MIKKFIKKVVGNLGYSINKRIPEKQPAVSIVESNPFIGYDFAKEGFDAVQLTKEYTMLAPINLFMLYE